MRTEIPLAQILREVRTFKEQYQLLSDLKQVVDGHSELLLTLS